MTLKEEVKGLKEEVKELKKIVLESKVESAKDKGKIRVLESMLNLETQERKNNIEEIWQALKDNAASKILDILDQEDIDTLWTRKKIGIWPF